jgi:hypothetical protein
MAKSSTTGQPKPTKRLRELDPPGGVGLGRVQDFDADHADAILAHEAANGVKNWELVDETVQLSPAPRDAAKSE